MAAVIDFPAARIVRPIKQRVARPRKQAVAVDQYAREAGRLAEMMVDRALSKGLTLEHMARRVYAEKCTDDGALEDKLMLGLQAALKAELRKRMGPAPVIPMSVRLSAQWPSGGSGENLEELARLGYEECMRRTGNDTMENARKRALQVWVSIQRKNRGEDTKEASP
jgi:hypothetical protein